MVNHIPRATSTEYYHALARLGTRAVVTDPRYRLMDDAVRHAYDMRTKHRVMLINQWFIHTTPEVIFVYVDIGSMTGIHRYFIPNVGEGYSYGRFETIPDKFDDVLVRQITKEHISEVVVHTVDRGILNAETMKREHTLPSYRRS